MLMGEGRHRKIAPRHQDTLLSSASVISILIVSFNTAPELVACLESLARCAAALPHEIIVVDNGSTDGSVEAVRTRFPAVQLVTNQENLGFSKASNQALPLARGEYVLFLNPDSEMHPGTLERMLAELAGFPERAAVGPRVRKQHEFISPNCARRLPTLWTELSNLLCWTGSSRGRASWPGSTMRRGPGPPIGTWSACWARRCCAARTRCAPWADSTSPCRSISTTWTCASASASSGDCAMSVVRWSYTITVSAPGSCRTGSRNALVFKRPINTSSSIAAKRTPGPTWPRWRLWASWLTPWVSLDSSEARCGRHGAGGTRRASS